VDHVRFNRFLHQNEHPQRILWCLVRQLSWESSKKLGNFSLSCLTSYQESFEYVHLDVNVYWVSPDSLWNFTIGIIVKMEHVRSITWAVIWRGHGQQKREQQRKVVLQDIKKSFEYDHLDVHIYWISPDSLWNSTTFITGKMVHVRSITWAVIWRGHGQQKREQQRKVSQLRRCEQRPLAAMDPSRGDLQGGREKTWTHHRIVHSANPVKLSRMGRLMSWRALLWKLPKFQE